MVCTPFCGRGGGRQQSVWGLLSHFVMSRGPFFHFYSFTFPHQGHRLVLLLLLLSTLSPQPRGVGGSARSGVGGGVSAFLFSFFSNFLNPVQIASPSMDVDGRNQPMGHNSLLLELERLILLEEEEEVGHNEGKGSEDNECNHNNKNKNNKKKDRERRKKDLMKIINHSKKNKKQQQKKKKIKKRGKGTEEKEEEEEEEQEEQRQKAEFMSKLKNLTMEELRRLLKEWQEKEKSPKVNHNDSTDASGNLGSRQEVISRKGVELLSCEIKLREEEIKGGVYSLVVAERRPVCMLLERCESADPEHWIKFQHTPPSPRSLQAASATSAPSVRFSLSPNKPGICLLSLSLSVL